LHPLDPHTTAFSLIELLTVLVVVAILYSVALPSWRSSLQSARRADATLALMHTATKQERFWLANHRYGTAAELGVRNSDAGHYRLSVELTATGYLARAAATGAQAHDGRCKEFILHANGHHTATADDDSDNTGYCWKD
jgi:type IV pilus assembly protein PilE